ncbi:MAG: ATP-binding cassette domain-containing protein [Planctomycetes bacterium]|nr:ATP-binding cassette domain-containing protein [Planctomycetota bacterium]
MDAKASSTEVILSVRDIVVRFPCARGGMMTVLDGVDFDVRRGETVVILGGSGSGKSTLLNCMIGEIEPDAGTILYDLPSLPSVDIIASRPQDADAVRKRIGILFQSGALFSSMTVAENVALPLREHSHVDPAIIDIVVAIKLEQVHMLPHRDKYPAQLSGGQKKRAGLARATALDPLILFYDEPSAGLDPVTSSAIDGLIIDLAKKMHVTSIVVTHEMDSAFRIADRMIMLDNGRILREGTRDELDRIRKTPAERLGNPTDALLNQFLNGGVAGPLTDATGTSLYENLLIGERTSFLRKTRT